MAEAESQAREAQALTTLVNAKSCNGGASSAEFAAANRHVKSEIQPYGEASWLCEFLGCEGKIRLADSDRPWRFSHLPVCEKCHDPIATTANDRAALLTIIERNLF